MKKLILFITIIVIFSLSACNKETGNSDDELVLNIAYQYGMAYAPVIVMKEQGLIEKHYDGNVKVKWQQLNSGAAINESVISGHIQVAYMGIAPFITAVMKGTPYKLYTGLSAQPMGLNTYDESINRLSDLTKDDKIALVNIGSIQHIMLAMAADKELGDPRALDENIIAMSHPDGMQAMVSRVVKAHLTTAPYFIMELEDFAVHEITSVREAFPENCSIIIGAATIELYDNNKELYEALVKATDEAMEYINNNINDTAKLICENEGVTEETMLGYLQENGVKYSKKASGVMEIARFMKKAEFIDKAPEAFSDIAFDEVEE